MSDIYLERDHDLGQEACQEMADELVDKWVRKIGGRKRVEDNVVYYRHINGTRGELTIEEDFISVEVKLGLMVKALRRRIENEIEAAFDKYIDD